MRRPFVAFLSLLLALGLSLVALETATAGEPQARPKPTTRTVTVPIEVWKQSAAQTPGGRLDYCAVAAFVLFADIDGFEPTSVDYTFTYPNGTAQQFSDGLEAPYDDTWTWGPLSRNAPAGRHQEMLGDQPSAWSAGSPDCEAPYAFAAQGYGPSPTATVTYEPTARCARAIASYNAADAALTSARKRLDKARTPAQKAAAAAQVRTAKATLAKARKAWKKRC